MKTPLPQPGVRGRARRRGFTLIEAAFATMVIGLGVTALIQLMAAGTVANADGTEMTTAINLANNVHEATLTLSYAQVLALNNKDYSPPVNSNFKSISQLGTTWKQHVDVGYLNPDNLNGATVVTVQPTARVTCTVSHNGAAVYKTIWVVTNVP
jgi:type II secretory pathway pseudopilin PulG